MEIILFLIALGIIFYLYKTFQEYLSGEKIAPNDKDEIVIQVQRNIEPPIDPKEKLKASEYGIILRILGKLSYVDNNSCPLEDRLIHGMITDMSHDTGVPEKDYFDIYKESENEDVQNLAHLFAAETIGQYKKRLKIVEFMFALSYADGNFTKDEEDMIIDVAAILEIENDDFNKIYDEFKDYKKKDSDKEMTREEAMSLLKLNEGFSREELEEAYKKAFDSKRQNVLDPKNLNRPYNESRDDIENFALAYKCLLRDS